MARNHDYLIGLNGGIPWKVPEDRAYFKETTAGGVLVMGRYTWLENKRHLPHAARTVVLSSDSEFRDRIGSLDRVDTAATLREALEIARPTGAEEEAGKGVWVVGGEEMYRRSLIDFNDKAREIHLTVLDDGTSGPSAEEMEGAKFPKPEEWAGSWELRKRWTGERSGEKNRGIKYEFQVWGRSPENR